MRRRIPALWWFALLAALPAGAASSPGAAPSPGCTNGAAGLRVVDVLSSGHHRPMSLFVPRAGQEAALPLVFDLHGSGGNGAAQAALTGMNELGAREGFMVAHPEGAVVLPGAPGAHYWNIPGVPLIGGAEVPAGTDDDVQYISDAIDAIGAQTCLDASRVYATGMSGGARMTSLLACRLGARFAAIAPVDGLRAGLPVRAAGAAMVPDPASCPVSHAVPLLAFHGTGDRVNPYDGGGGPYWGYGVEAALRRWSEINHCPGNVVSRRLAAHVVEVRYTGCPQQAEIVLVRVEAGGADGGGHAWPGGHLPEQMAATAPGPPPDRPSAEIDASTLIWKFFRQHRLPAP